MPDVDIQLRRVTKRFGRVTAVDDVSFTVQRGSFFSLLGPSGCGKTTILRMISGFEAPSEGEILISGRSMAGVPAYRRPTNLVFQHLSLFPHLSVSENIGFGLEMKKVAKSAIGREIAAMLELIELPGFGDRRIHQLSGGQQQRVAIARALINKPTVVLLDEPLGALDLKLRNQMQLELKRIQREVGTTFVYVTHDQGEAITMSDHMAVMNQGRIEQIGPCEEIYDRPQTAFVAGFIGETNFLDGEIESIRDSKAVIRAHGLRVETASGGTASGPATLCIRPEKIRLGRNLGNMANVFPARVVEVVYQGGSSTYTVELENGLRLTATAQNADEEMRFAEDENVRVGWRPENAVVIPGGRNG
jgi:spermidine/putrescine transport system ATP-binding protein